eukprot:symbB.v1.2.006631.t1/scaffold390.1/size254036/27
MPLAWSNPKLCCHDNTGANTNSNGKCSKCCSGQGDDSRCTRTTTKEEAWRDQDTHHSDQESRPDLGSIQLSVHQKLASLSEARAPPEASRKRKMEMDQGFVEVEFQIGEHPLGLVVDWSMALPVVSGDLRPGLVLLAINDIPLIFGVSRHEVERILSLRPLSLLFEAPIKELVRPTDLG